MVNFKSKQNGFTEEEIVREILDDYSHRKEEKRAHEQSWLLNINFLIGNQFAYVLPSGEVGESAKLYPYESREVFNHIAPIIDSRLAKLNKVMPTVSVRPASSSTEDEEAAKLSKSLVNFASEEIKLSSLMKDAAVWSEVTGSVFYKVVPLKGEEGLPFEVCVVSPFEIFPSSSSIEKLEDNPSIIHARAIHISDAEKMYNLTGLKGEEISSMTMDLSSSGIMASGTSNVRKLAETKKKDQILVIERYFRASSSEKNGWLQVIVGDHLVYDGVIPFGAYPFIKQVSAPTIGSFWGTSIIDRCIPVQRAYNAVKNRKLEYMARFSAGVLCVEEGSVDVDSLECDGLAPGKVIVYRAGASVPKFMDNFSIPSDFSYEEERLLNELITLTGVSELMRNSLLPTNVTSGTAISLLTEADNTRLAVPAESIRAAYLSLCKKMLEIFKESKVVNRLSRCYDEKGRVQLVYWSSSDLCAFDVVLDSVNELAESPAERKNMVMELFKLGLFSGEDGALDKRAKAKILDMVGFSNFESGQDLSDVHLARARGENSIIKGIMVLEVDDHNLHIAEHTKCLIEKELSKEDEEKLIMHIREHKAFMKIASEELNG